MSDLKQRLLSLSPTRAEGARLPAALAALLVTAAAVQLALPQPGVPDEAVPRRAPDWRLPEIAPLPALVERPSLFSPLRVTAATIAADGTPAPTGPLDGAWVLGVMRMGPRATVLLRTADGQVIRLAPGAIYKGWRLVAAGEDSAGFRKGASTIRVPYGAAPPTGSADDQENSETSE